MKMIFLIDGDNHVLEGLTGIDMLSAEDHVLIFHKKGAQLTKVKNMVKDSKANVEYIASAKDGKNSIDFQIISELSIMVGRSDVEFAYIISQDKGYEAPIAFLKKRYPKEFREVSLKPSIEECLKLTFMLKATTTQELHNALVREYGNAQGSLVYSHLKALFS